MTENKNNIPLYVEEKIIQTKQNLNQEKDVEDLSEIIKGLKLEDEEKSTTPVYYGIVVNFDVQDFLKKYFDSHPKIDRKFFDQLIEKKRIPTDHHVTLVHKKHQNAKKGSDRSEEAKKLWKKYKKIVNKGKVEVDITFSQIVYNSKIMALVVKEVKPSDIESFNKVPHTTVATIDNSVKPFQSNEMLEKALIEKQSDAVIVKLDKEVQVTGFIKDFPNYKSTIDKAIPTN